MRSGFAITLIVSLLFAGGYFYILAETICPIPVSYRIGQLDERFGLTLEEAKAATAEAALVWEEAIGQTLFIYDEEADFTVNFIFDERQEFILEEGALKDSLNTVEDVNDALNETHALLTAQYEQLKGLYEAEIASYDRRLTAYEQTVDEYNQNGGITSEVRDKLQAERASLQAEQAALEAQAQEINVLVQQINELGKQGNALINRYNENVGQFNERFGDSREFTQGDYRGDHINIYTFANKAELQTVLAHEFGHALSLDHVEGDSSVMYYLIGDQPVDLQLSETDVAEFNRICEEMSLWAKIEYKLTSN